MPTFNSCTKYVGSPGIIYDRLPPRFPGHGCMDDLTTERKLRGSLMCLAYIFDMISMGVCISPF